MNGAVVKPAERKRVKTAATAGLVVAGCAACCAPLIAAPILGLFAAGGAGLALVGKIGLGAVVMAAVPVYYLSTRRRGSKAIRVTSATCACRPNAGCNAGHASDLPAVKSAKVEGGHTQMREKC